MKDKHTARLNPEPSDVQLAIFARHKRNGTTPGNPKWYRMPTLPRFEFKAGLPPKFPAIPTGADWNKKHHGSKRPVVTRYVGENAR